MGGEGADAGCAAASPQARTARNAKVRLLNMDGVGMTLGISGFLRTTAFRAGSLGKIDASQPPDWCPGQWVSCVLGSVSSRRLVACYFAGVPTSEYLTSQGRSENPSFEPIKASQKYPEASV